MDGLLTLIAVGNVACFYEALIFRADIKQLTPAAGCVSSKELGIIRMAYQQMMVMALRDHEVDVETVEEPTNADFTVFHAAITRFARSILSYAVKELAIQRFSEEDYVTYPLLRRLQPHVLFNRFKRTLEEFWPGQWDHIQIPDYDGPNAQGADFEQRIELEEQEITMKP